MTGYLSETNLPANKMRLQHIRNLEDVKYYDKNNYRADGDSIVPERASSVSF